ncbi:MAG: flagellar biosynthesis protein FlhB [Oscillospiraceae bacterium]|nr:flagellar biosynthesis protein FlhB [Oscillospiraceae bacterium]
MADGGGQEKTEKATSHKRQEQRKKGNVMQSKDVVTAAFILVVFNVLRMTIRLIYHSAQKSMTYWIGISGGGMEGNGTVIDGVPVHIKVIFEIIKTVLLAAGPTLIVAAIVSIIASGTQTKWIRTLETTKPKFSKLNPLKGMKKFFSLKSIFEVIKNLIKLALIAAIIYNEVKIRFIDFAKTFDWEILTSLTYMVQAIYWAAMKIGLAFIFVAALDYMYQKWQWEKDMKMTKQEVKEEFKNTEGDPKVKGKRRQIQMRMAMQRMMQSVPEADVIIRNPTHFAVAVRYDHDNDNAPFVLAKGKDNLALKIIKLAEENNVTLVENKPLAKALYETVEVDKEIPANFYQAVAEILAFVYDLKKKASVY